MKNLRGGWPEDDFKPNDEVTLIRESEERFRSLVESSPNSIILTDSSGIIRLVNHQTEQIFGYKRTELLGNKLEILLPERVRRKHVKFRSGYYENPQTRPMGAGRHLFGLHKNGNEVPVEIGLTPIYSHGRLMILSTIVDITERKNAEEKLITQNAELIRYNNELKSKTALLIQSEKMSALGTLVAGIAHELNNPITGILNYAQYCRNNSGSNPRIASVLDDLLFETRRCAALVNNLLVYSHYSSNDDESRFAETDLKDVIQRVLALFNHLLTDITLSVRIDERFPVLAIETTKLQQVISNVIKNAIDAVQLSTVKEINIIANAETGYCTLVVQDTGTGIAPEILQRIFDPFYSTKPVGKGTGLGLSITRSIIEEINGEISARSEQNNGTSIYIKIPYSSTVNNGKQ